jgi:TfoX/Sxy family transcriptional regulator of competence genes
VAYDEELAARIRERLRGVDGVSEKTMFGGRVFLVDGNIAVGAYGDDLLVRAHPDEIPDLITKGGVRPFRMGGRATRGFVLVSGGDVDDAELKRWIGVARAYLATLRPTR